MKLHGESLWRPVGNRLQKFRVKGVIEGIPSTIDPCVFVDDDGQPYIYTSGAGQGCWGEVA